MEAPDRIQVDAGTKEREPLTVIGPKRARDMDPGE